MYSEADVLKELESVYYFLKKYGQEHTLVYLQLCMNDYKKRGGDL